MGILLILKLIPNLTGQALAQERFCSSRENWEAIDVCGLLEVRTALGLLFGTGGACGLLGNGGRF